MKFRHLATGAAVALGVAALSLPAAHADVILTYTGNHFTDAVFPYTTADKVTAAITLTNPLGDDVNLEVTPLEFILNDGVQTLQGPATGINGMFIFSTNASGMITAWNVIVHTEAALPSLENFISTIDNGLSDTVDDAESQTGSANNLLSPGVWTVSAVTVPAPPPSNLTA